MTKCSFKKQNVNSQIKFVIICVIRVTDLLCRHISKLENGTRNPSLKLLKQAGFKSEYVIPANSEKMVKERVFTAMKQVSYGVKENIETLINTDVLLGNIWQHPKIPILKPLNIAETPENAALAFPEASLGEDIPSQGRISIFFRIHQWRGFH